MNEQAYNVNLGNVISNQAPEPQPMEGDALPPSNEMLVDYEIRDMILNRIKASRDFFAEKKVVQDKCWQHYKQVYDTTNKESWQSTTFIPASPKVAEVIASNMHSAQLAPERPVEYQERQPAFADPVRDANDLIAVDMERSQFKVHWTDVLRSTCIIGTGVGKVEYKKEYADVIVKERVKEMPGMAFARRMMGFPPAPTETSSIQRMTVKDFASLKNVDRYDVFPEPGSTEIDKDHWIIERGKICNYKLIELSQDPEMPLVGVTPEVLASNPKTTDESSDKAEKDAALGETVKTSAYLDPDQEHELLEYWGPAPKYMVQPELWGDEKSKYDIVYAWFWLIDGQHVVRRQVTPWRDAEPPYVKSVYIRVPGQWDGIGPLEIILNLQIELNERVNTQQDEINLKLSKPIAVIKSMVAAGEWGRLVSGPGALWVFDQTDDVKKAFQTIEYDANLQDSWRAIQWLLNEIQEASAAVKAVVGNDGGGGQDEAATFRGQMLNKQVASERFIMYARLNEITGLGHSYRKYYQRIYQYKGFEEAAQILGPERAQKFQFIPPEQLDQMAKLVPMGVTTMENKGVKLAQMAEQFQMFSMYPWFKPVEHARKMIEIGGDSPDLSIMTDDELKIYNEQKRIMLSQAGAPPEGMDGMGGPPQPGSSNGGPPSPIAGNVPGPTDGQPRPAMPPRGPGASPMDLNGRPM